MNPNSKSIIVDHYFKRYFYLGSDLDLCLEDINDPSLIAIENTLYSYGQYHNLPEQAQKIFDFIESVPEFAREIMSDNSRYYRYVTDYFGYQMDGSRFTLSPITLDCGDRISITLVDPTPSELAKCTQRAVSDYILRVGAAPVIAFEAIRRGRANALPR